MQEAPGSRISNVALKSDPAAKKNPNADQISQMWEMKLKSLSQEFKSEQKNIGEKPGWCFNQLNSRKKYLYLVKGWHGGLIRTTSKDRLLNSSSVIP